MSDVRVRPIESADWPAILEMNGASVDLVSPLDAEALAWLVQDSFQAIAVEGEGAVAAFALVLKAGSAYASPNYRWFSERYAEFLYLDRVVVAESWRRRGVATIVYDFVEQLAAAFRFVLCEVDLDPPNLPSLGFHAARGFQEVGRRTSASGKTLAMLAKEVAREVLLNREMYL